MRSLSTAQHAIFSALTAGLVQQGVFPCQVECRPHCTPLLLGAIQLLVSCNVQGHRLPDKL